VEELFFRLPYGIQQKLVACFYAIVVVEGDISYLIVLTLYIISFNPYFSQHFYLHLYILKPVLHRKIKENSLRRNNKGM